MIQVDYSRSVASRAMNKTPEQKGLALSVVSAYRWEDGKKVDVGCKSIKLECINKKLGKITTDLYLSIPVEDIDKVIEALQKLK